MVKLIDDEHIFEGILGGIALAIFTYYLQKHKPTPPIVDIFLAFILAWYIRRVGVNLYLHYTKDE